MISQKKYWICIINGKNWDKLKKHKIWGVTMRYANKIKNTNIGDMLIFYITQKKIGGIYEVSSKYFEDNDPIFDSNQYIYRVKLKPFLLPENPIEFNKELIQKLSFIKNKKNWAGYIRQPMKIIPESDFNIITSTFK